MNRLVIFIVLLLGLTSCGMQKRVMSQDVQADSRREAYDSTALSSQIDKLVKDALIENLQVLTNQEIRLDRKIYSEPDSLGQQYIREEQKMTIQTSTEENRILAVDSISESVESVDSIATSASVEDLEMEAITDIEEKQGLPWWQKTLMLVGAAVLAWLTIKIILRFV